MSTIVRTNDAWPDAPLDESAYVRLEVLEHMERSPYTANGHTCASSRHVPNPLTFPAPGAWALDHRRGLYGREVLHCVALPVAALSLPELVLMRQLATLDPAKAGDEERYAQWLREGLSPPPIYVVQTEQATLQVINGHRRVLAARLAGHPGVHAWVSYAVRIPSGGRYGGHSGPGEATCIRTGLTLEMLTGEVANPYLADRLPLPLLQAEADNTHARTLDQVLQRPRA